MEVRASRKRHHDDARSYLRMKSTTGLVFLFSFTSFGPDTLRELRAAWAAVDDAAHVNRFPDMHDVGDLMMASGFSQPVVDAELIHMQYQRLQDLLDDLRHSGARLGTG